MARALELGTAQTANALAIAGTAFNALRVTRTGALSNWKGLAGPAMRKLWPAVRFSVTRTYFTVTSISS